MEAVQKPLDTTAADGKRQPRILFLADRNILANQAYLDFGAFGDDALVRITPSDIAKRGEVPNKRKCVLYHLSEFYEWKRW